MSRKYIDDHVELRLTLNNGVGFDHLPGTNDTRYEPGHMCLDPISGKRFVNEGPNDRSTTLFLNPWVNCIELADNLDTLPQLAAAFAAGINWNLCIVGTNAASADAAFTTTGSVQLGTHGASADSTILVVHSTSKNIWAATSLIPDNQLIFEASIVSDATITNQTVWTGLKLTNTDVAATDADQTYFRYQDTANGGRFQCIDANTTVLTTQDSGVAVVASTAYLLQIKVGKDRAPRYYINGELVATGQPLKAGAVYLPFLGVKANSAAVAKVQARGIRIVMPIAPLF